MKVVTDIIGAASFISGTSAQPGKFRAVPGVAEGSTNHRMIGPAL
jgi:hypothetical protein